MANDQNNQPERCSKCRQFKPIVKRLPGGFVEGSLMKRRPVVLVCAECDAENERQAAASQRLYASDMVKMIEGIIAETPAMADRVASHLATWKERAK